MSIKPDHPLAGLTGAELLIVAKAIKPWRAQRDDLERRLAQAAALLREARSCIVADAGFCEWTCISSELTSRIDAYLSAEGKS